MRRKSRQARRNAGTITMSESDHVEDSQGQEIPPKKAKFEVLEDLELSESSSSAGRLNRFKCMEIVVKSIILSIGHFLLL